MNFWLIVLFSFSFLSYPPTYPSYYGSYYNSPAIPQPGWYSPHSPAAAPLGYLFLGQSLLEWPHLKCSQLAYHLLGFLLLVCGPLGYLLLLYHPFGHHLQAISHQLFSQSLHLQLLGETTHVPHTPPIHTTFPFLQGTSYLQLEDPISISHHHKL